MRLRIGLTALATLLVVISPSFLLNFPAQFLRLQVLAQTQNNRKVRADELLRQGDKQYRASQIEAALQSWQQALSIYRAIQYRGATQLDHVDNKIWEDPGEADALYRLGDAYYSLQDYNQAIDYYKQYLTLVRELQNSQEAICDFPFLCVPKKLSGIEYEGIALVNIGCAFLESGDFTQAEKTLRNAVQVLESTEGLGDRELFFAPLQSTYRLLQKALIAQNQITAALEISERSRTITSPAIRQIQHIAKDQNATLVEYAIIYDTSFEHSIIHYGSIGGGSGKEQESELFIWVIKPTGNVVFRRVDLKPVWQQQDTSLATIVTNTRESIGVTSRSSFDFEPGAGLDYTQRLQQLHKLLIEPIADQLPTEPSDHIIFIPQGSLFLAPFPAFQDANGKYLVEKHTIRTAPSIQVLELTNKLRQRLPKLKDVLVVGNPTMPYAPSGFGDPTQQLRSLPQAQQEAEAIASQFNTHALIGNDATKSAVVQQMPKARIIHLATHGLLDDIAARTMILRNIRDRIEINIEGGFALFDGDNSRPFGLEGMVALAPSGKDDGFLTAREISKLKLNAELVVLSACDSGRGYVTGTGVAGLSRAFISAGVPSVIVSLWSLPDAPTASLMTEFYHNLAQSSDKAQALRQAMLTMMKKNYKPSNWAAFTLIGEAK